MTVSNRASLVLVFTCACWAFSFPIMKSIEQVGRDAVPGASSVFFAALCIAIRFTLAGLVLGTFCGRSLTGVTRLEIQQGGGLGLFGGLGLVLQMDGMAYTLASTSAFLTQAYCVLIPVWMCLRHLRWPAPQVAGACFLALLGAALLARLGSDGFRFGRGEWETLAGSVLFTGQILWLERPVFHGNNSMRATTVMFFVMALTTWPMALLTAPTPGATIAAYSSPSALTLLLLLTGLCTLITFPLANHWQPRITATQAGLLYCTEPVFTSFIALFFPGWISHATGIRYPNETLTFHLVSGGLLILAANAWLLLHPPPLHTPSR
jgi:drug/metabolite transporter (DMT)-like permease